MLSLTGHPKAVTKEARWATGSGDMMNTTKICRKIVAHNHHVGYLLHGDFSAQPLRHQDCLAMESMKM
jgi:hypothetical protein